MQHPPVEAEVFPLFRVRQHRVCDRAPERAHVLVHHRRRLVGDHRGRAGVAEVGHRRNRRVDVDPVFINQGLVLVPVERHARGVVRVVRVQGVHALARAFVRVPPELHPPLRARLGFVEAPRAAARVREKHRAREVLERAPGSRVEPEPERVPHERRLAVPHEVRGDGGGQRVRRHLRAHVEKMRVAGHHAGGHASDAPVTVDGHLLGFGRVLVVQVKHEKLLGGGWGRVTIRGFRFLRARALPRGAHPRAPGARRTCADRVLLRRRRSARLKTGS